MQEIETQTDVGTGSILVPWNICIGTIAEENVLPCIHIIRHLRRHSNLLSQLETRDAVHQVTLDKTLLAFLKR